MKFTTGEAIFMGALLLSLVGFVASYNKALGEYEGRVHAITEQSDKFEQRLQTIERDLRACKP